MNDPQRPFWLDGRWHYYYLYNADYPDGNGTAWYHATSTDLVHWREEGVAIEKYENGLGDIETGSAVIDTDNTAGFGAGAVIAIMTQQHDGVQRQSLFVSTDGGHRFDPYDGNPVMDNPGEAHWRDPKIVWDDERHEWLMVLAEGHKLGFYTSHDLKASTYRSGFERDDLGILECPDLFRMSIDGDPAKTTWVLAAGVNGGEHGMTTGTAYWTGDWDGEAYTASDENRRGSTAAPTSTRRSPGTTRACPWPTGSRRGTRSAGSTTGPTPATCPRTTGTAAPTRSCASSPCAPSMACPPSSRTRSARSTRSRARPRRSRRERVTDTATTTLPQPDTDAYRLRLEVAPDRGIPRRRCASE